MAVKEQCARDAMPIENVVEQMPANEHITNATWGVGHVTCEKLLEMIAATEKRMKAIESECETDARRHFIPPAEARLY